MNAVDACAFAAVLENLVHLARWQRITIYADEEAGLGGLAATGEVIEQRRLRRLAEGDNALPATFAHDP